MATKSSIAFNFCYFFQPDSLILLGIPWWCRRKNVGVHGSSRSVNFWTMRWTSVQKGWRRGQDQKMWESEPVPSPHLQQRQDLVLTPFSGIWFKLIFQAHNKREQSRIYSIHVTILRALLPLRPLAGVKSSLVAAEKCRLNSGKAPLERALL